MNEKKEHVNPMNDERHRLKFLAMNGVPSDVAGRPDVGHPPFEIATLFSGFCAEATVARPRNNCRNPWLTSLFKACALSPATLRHSASNCSTFSGAACIESGSGSGETSAPTY